MRVKLQPRAACDEIGEAWGEELKVRVRAPPVDEAANGALLRLLAEALECPRNALRLIRGRTSRHKVVAVVGLGPDEVLARLSARRGR